MTFVAVVGAHSKAVEKVDDEETMEEVDYIATCFRGRPVEN